MNRRGALAAAALVVGVAAFAYVSDLRCGASSSGGGLDRSEPRTPNNRTAFGAGGPRKKRRLEFVHITKTGGTAIEKAAVAVGVRWGYCHHFQSTVCNSPFTTNDVNPLGGGYGSTAAKTNPWHTPPWVLASHAEYFTRNPYEDADLFTVVRNPYTRVVSEYYCPWVGLRKDDRDEMNKWIAQKLKGQTHEGLHGRLEALRAKGAGGGFFLGSKHLIPQYEYVFSPDGERLISEENVLRFENISTEFPRLMERYDLGDWIKLSAEKTNAGKNGQQLSHLDLYHETVRMINEFYEKDFAAFGYERVEAFYRKNGTNETTTEGYEAVKASSQKHATNDTTT